MGKRDDGKTQAGFSAACLALAVVVWCLIEPNASVHHVLFNVAAGGPPIVRGSSGFVQGGKAVTMILPSGTLDGDLLIANIHTGGEAMGAFTDWTVCPGVSTNTVGTSCPSVGCAMTNCLFNSWNAGDNLVTGDSGDHQFAQIIGIEAGTWDTGDPFGASGSNDSIATTTVLSLGITTDADDSLVISMTASVEPDANSGSGSEYDSPQCNGLATVSERGDFNRNTGLGGGVWSISGTLASKGTTNNCFATADSVAGDHAHMLFEIHSPP